MASKFGKLGDVDILLSEIRRKVSQARSTVFNVRQAAQENAIGNSLSNERVAQLLQEAEDLLDEIAS